MEWIDISEKEPEEYEPVLFREMFKNLYHVGYWSKAENCMLETPYGSGGKKWSVEEWRSIDD